MADGTKIEWTDATWNVVNGCNVVSPGCTNCYAMRLAGTRLKHHPSREGLTIDTKAGPVWNGQVRFNEKVLLDPLRWKRPRRIFPNAHGDLFHPSVPDEWIDREFTIMALAHWHYFQVLTKRPDRMRDYVSERAECIWSSVDNFVDDWSHGLRGNVRLPIISDDPMLAALAGQGAVWGGERPWPLRNVWLGTSVEDQRRADERIPILLDTPAAVRWLSCEPLLGPVDVQPFGLYDRELHWVVAGGESGPGARPMHPDWARSLRDQCAAAGVPFLFKQWGEWLPCEVDFLDGDVVCYPDDGSERDMPEVKGVRPIDQSIGRDMWRVGKKVAGRLLDGVQHDGYPQ
jgi:protein gp37